MRISRTKALGIAGGLLFAAQAVGGFVPAQADNHTGGSEVIVGIIDTGVRATHKEFSYLGPTSTTDQFVGWWDFSTQKGPAQSPAPGVTWDNRGGVHPSAPYDGYGHGTAVASMAVGLNVSTVKTTPSLAPGYKLAVAKVANDNGSFTGDVPAAVRWMVDTVKADVINLSFSYSIAIVLPAPSFLTNMADSIRYATQRGVTVTVANGNGLANLGLIAANPGDANSPADVPEAISVGASGLNGFLVSTDPEVAAVYSPVEASISCDTCYVNEAGTSFSSPYVAGFVARVIKAARDAGRSSEPAYVEQLLKYSAQDTFVPPAFEGYGILTGGQLSAAVTHAAAGTLPAANTANQLYVDTVAGSVRSISAG